MKRIALIVGAVAMAACLLVCSESQAQCGSGWMWSTCCTWWPSCSGASCSPCALLLNRAVGRGGSSRRLTNVRHGSSLWHAGRWPASPTLGVGYLFLLNDLIKGMNMLPRCPQQDRVLALVENYLEKAKEHYKTVRDLRRLLQSSVIPPDLTHKVALSVCEELLGVMEGIANDLKEIISTSKELITQPQT